MVTVSDLNYDKFSLVDVYGRNIINIPTGYEFVAFRRLKYGDLFLSNGNSENVLTTIGSWFTIKEPRIIVRQIAQIQQENQINKTFTKTWTVEEIYGTPDPKIPEGYEIIDFRFAVEKDVYLCVATNQAILAGREERRTPRLILKKKTQFYAKIPLISFVREPSSTYIQFKDNEGKYHRILMDKSVEIIEE